MQLYIFTRRLHPHTLPPTTTTIHGNPQPDNINRCRPSSLQPCLSLLCSAPVSVYVGGFSGFYFMVKYFRFLFLSLSCRPISLPLSRQTQRPVKWPCPWFPGCLVPALSESKRESEKARQDQTRPDQSRQRDKGSRLRTCLSLPALLDGALGQAANTGGRFLSAPFDHYSRSSCRQLLWPTRALCCYVFGDI